MKPIQLKDARKKAKMTQDDLARAVKRRQNHISRLEAGLAAEPSWQTQERIGKALGVPAAALRFGLSDTAIWRSHKGATS